jgi:hypothetical protein
MPYRLHSFDGVTLPEYLPEDDLGVGQVPSTIIDSLGGTFDYFGATRRQPKRHNISYRGKFVGQDNTLWVDDVGDFVVDELGDMVVLGSDYAADLRDRVDSLKAKIGVSGQLIRIREEDDEEQFKTARLLVCNHIRRVENIDRIAVVDVVLEAAGIPWKAINSTTTGPTAISSGANAFAVTVSGVEEVRDAVITVAATTNITNLIVSLGANQSWTFSGTIASGTSLVVDIGKQTVKNNGSDAYSSFTLDGAHTIDSWLRLSPGTNNMTVTITGGPGTIQAVHYDQWM